MKIVGQQPDPVASAVPSRVRSAARAGGGAPPPAGDRVELSPLARTLQKLRAEAGDLEAVDRERVAELRRAIADGTYDPSPEDVAQALLRELAANRLV